MEKEEYYFLLIFVYTFMGNKNELEFNQFYINSIEGVNFDLLVAIELAKTVKSRGSILLWSR